MAKYKVKFTEIYHRTIDIEADSPEQAYDIVDEMVSEGDIDLPYNEIVELISLAEKENN